ncbi:hypothetical protein FQZ97_995650 [compost metagenome]
MRDFSRLFSRLSGRGLMMGLHAKTGEIAALFVQEALRRGLLVTPCLSTPTVVRVSPPVVATAGDFAVFDRMMREAALAVCIELVDEA